MDEGSDGESGPGPRRHSLMPDAFLPIPYVNIHLKALVLPNFVTLFGNRRHTLLKIRWT